MDYEVTNFLQAYKGPPQNKMHTYVTHFVTSYLICRHNDVTHKKIMNIIVVSMGNISCFKNMFLLLLWGNTNFMGKGDRQKLKKRLIVFIFCMGSTEHQWLAIKYPSLNHNFGLKICSITCATIDVLTLLMDENCSAF